MYNILKKIEHRRLIEEKGKMRSRKRIFTPVENTEKTKRNAQKEILILRMHAVCIDNHL